MKNVPSPLVGKVVVDVVVVVEVVVGVVVEVAVVVVAVVIVEVCVVVDAVVDGVEVVESSHCSRMGCLGPDSLLQCLTRCRGCCREHRAPVHRAQHLEVLLAVAGVYHNITLPQNIAEQVTVFRRYY